MRPIARSGTILGEVGDTGADVGGFHLHFCITTKPDRAQFAPFESMPVAFRNYSVSTDNGRSWTFVPVGVPKLAQWVRRENRAGPTAPQIAPAADVVGFGTVRGEITPPPDMRSGAAGSRLVVQVHSKWGEHLASRTIAVPGNPAGPWAYEIVDVPSFGDLKVVASYEGGQNATGESPLFELKPGGTGAANIELQPVPGR